ncbi:MAG: SPFH domain-containing protein [Actinobacteria bacterium]|nr:SPFH domain-containing protein [Actinomycetota bacterium]
MNMGGLITLGVIVFLVVLFLVNAIKIVPEYQRLVVFRLGRLLATKGPGLVILIPFVDRGTKVDLREFFLEIPRQDSITKDNAAIGIDFILYYKVIDSANSVVKVSNFAGAATNIAATTLRAVVGDISLDDMLARRDEINSMLRTKLDEVTERWGVKVTNVEIREITPPPMVQEAMTRQMSAERSRRAVVTEAEGTKQAAITVSEGNKQAAILEAEGQRQGAILRAEGFAEALGKIQAVAKDVDVKTLSLQYLETLKTIGSSPSTKFVLPMEVTGLLQRLAVDARKAFGGDGEGLGGSS